MQLLYLQFWQKIRQQWQSKRLAEKPPVTLTLRRIYIIPTRSGMIFFLTLLAMIVGAMNYNNSLAYALTFLLAGVGFVAMWHTFRNLYQLQLYCQPPKAVFAGETAKFALEIRQQRNWHRYALELIPAQGDVVRAIDVAPNSSEMIALPQLCNQRGVTQLAPFTLRTIFPLGLLLAWSPQKLAVEVVVYPQPIDAGPLPAGEGQGVTHSPTQQRKKGEEFEQIRAYQRGDSIRHIHWKAIARGLPMQTKQFGGSGGGTRVVLRWEELAQYPPEQRLGRLCQWCLDAERSGCLYGLSLPGKTIEPSQGDDHLHRCLTMLARY